MRRKQTYSDVNPFTHHQRMIARSTMRMSCIGARIMGGMDHVSAAAFLHVKVPSDCTCGLVNIPDLSDTLRYCSCGRPTPDGRALCPECLELARNDDGPIPSME